VLLTPPLLWLGVVYLGSLSALLLRASFDRRVLGPDRPRVHAQDLCRAAAPANLDIILRTVVMAAAVTWARRSSPFPSPISPPATRGGGWKALFYLARHAAALVELSGQGLRLEADPRQGGDPQLGGGQTRRLGLLNAVLALPVIGGNSLSVSYIGTFIVFLYVWLPFMILPIQARWNGCRPRCSRPPRSRREPAPDLPDVILPLALPGGRRRVDLHLLADAGRLHHPADRRLVAPVHRAGGLPAIRAPPGTSRWPRPSRWCRSSSWVYLWMAKRKGAFDAL
jgi:putative spermidine/putrescine transport system permease protein